MPVGPLIYFQIYHFMQISLNMWTPIQRCYLMIKHGLHYWYGVICQLIKRFWTNCRTNDAVLQDLYTWTPLKRCCKYLMNVLYSLLSLSKYNVHTSPFLCVRLSMALCIYGVWTSLEFFKCPYCQVRPVQWKKFCETWRLCFQSYVGK